jgi:hypothetical protein
MTARHPFFWLATCTTLFSLCVATSGCSVIGFGLDTAIGGGVSPSAIVHRTAWISLTHGDHVQVTLSDSTVIEGEYEGMSVPDSNVQTDGEFDSVGVSHFTQIDTAGRTRIDFSELARMASAGHIPPDLSMIVRTASGTQHISFNHIVRLEKVSLNLRWTGAAIGLFMDIVSLALWGRPGFFLPL